MCYKIQSLLDKVYAEYQHIITDKLKSEKGDEQFNVFNVLGLWSEEVRLHSAMIAELLNPSGSHGCFDSFLRLFMSKVLKLPVKNHTSLTKALVEAEYYISPISDDGQEGGRIDVRVDIREDEVPSLIIENKIYAPDQKNQLLRYYNYCKKEYGSNRFKIIYLTLDGKCPSNFSIGNGVDISPICISYYKDIIPWLTQCAQIAFDKPKVREVIIQYINLLNQITDYQMHTTNNIVKTIIETDENLIGGLQICANKVELLKEAVLGRIKLELEKIANEAETRLTPLKVELTANDSFNTRGDKIDWWFSFIISSLCGQRVALKYAFATWDLKDLCYGIDQAQTSRDGIAKISRFGEPSDDWPWGRRWMNSYINWDCRTVSDILEEIHKDGLTQL